MSTGSAVPNGLALFEECLKFPEPLIDPAYCQDALIISATPDAEVTAIMAANAELQDRITAYDLAQRDGDAPGTEHHLVRITKLLALENMNFVEFTSFWPSLDVTYSAYTNLDTENQRAFLRQALTLYIERRHGTYRQHGYSPTSIQVRRDFEAHKRRGSAATAKLTPILFELGFTIATSTEQLREQPKTCGFFGTAGFQKADLLHLAEHEGVPFGWHARHQNKIPDFLIHNHSGRILLGEAKHMKESGGGQDKQVSELIDLISDAEVGERMSYVAFLDGVYFNSFAHPAAAGGKAAEQVGQIRAHLETQPLNYFVNTHGFRALVG